MISLAGVGFAVAGGHALWTVRSQQLERRYLGLGAALLCTGLAAIAGRGDRDAERHARRRLRGHAKTAELEQRWNLPVYVELVRADLIQAVDGAAQKYGDFGVALRPEKRTPVPALPLFDEGVWWAQDAGAAQAAQLLRSLPKGSKVLDMCSAPGGKALQLSSFGFEVVAIEKSTNRAARLRQNLQRCRCNVDVRVQDATLVEDMFDGVLVDAPCSATGTARRRPDVLRKDLDLEALAATQAALLDAAWRCLKPGGLLVFSSCSALTADAEASFAARRRENWLRELGEQKRANEEKRKAEEREREIEDLKDELRFREMREKANQQLSEELARSATHK